MRDTSGHEHHGTAFGLPSYTRDRHGDIGGALLFDGIDDRVNLDTSVMNFGKSDFSISFWIKTQGTSKRYAPVISKRPKCDQYNLYAVTLYNSDQTIGGGEQKNNSVINHAQSKSSIDHGKWTHFLYSRNGSENSVYINGKLEDRRVHLDVLQMKNSAMLWLGWEVCIPSAYYEFFNGSLDDLMFHKRTLSNKEIQTLYQGVSNPLAPVGLSARATSLCSNELKWTDTAFNEVGYLVQRAFSFIGPYEVIDTLPCQTEFYRDDDVMGDSTYYYQMTAFNKNGDSSSTVVSIEPNMKNGLVAKYMFEGNILDSSGNGYHGTAYRKTSISNPTFVASRQHGDSAIYLNGNGEFIVSKIGSRLPATRRSISLWFKADEGSLSDERGVLGYGGDGSCGSSFLQLLNNELSKTYETQQHCRVQRLMHPYTSPPEGKWYHWLIAIDDDSTHYYVNGKPVFASSSQYVTSIGSNHSLLIGIVPWYNGSPYLNPDVNSFKGALDDIRLFNRVVAPCEIRALYEGGHKPYPAVGLKANAASISSIRLFWRDSSYNERGYIIQRAYSRKGHFVTLDTLPCQAEYFLDTGLTECRAYCYRVGVYNGNGITWSDTVCTSPDIDAGLVAYYPFSDSILDESGNGFHGKVSGRVAFGPDRFGCDGNALYLDGNWQYMLAPIGNFLPENERSISVWFKADSASLVQERALLGYGGVTWNASRSFYALINNENSNSLEIQTGWGLNQVRSGYAKAPEKTWHHWVIVCSATEVTFYFDGLRIGSYPNMVTTDVDSSKNFIIGLIPGPSGLPYITSPPDVESWKGHIDDVRLFNRALSIREVGRLYNDTPRPYGISYPDSVCLNEDAKICMFGVEPGVEYFLIDDSTSAVLDSGIIIGCKKAVFTLRGVLRTQRLRILGSLAPKDCLGPLDTAFQINVINLKPPSRFDTLLCKSSFVQLKTEKPRINRTNWYYSKDDSAAFSSGEHIITLRVDSTSTYYVSYTNKVCESERSPITVKVNDPIPKPVVWASLNTICKGESTELNTPVGFNQYEWYLNFDTLSFDSSLIFVEQEGGYRVRVKDSSGCTSPISDALEITVNEKPIAQGAAHDVCEGEPTLLEDFSTSFASLSSITWRLENGEVEKGKTVETRAETAGEYSALLKVMDKNDCSDSMKVLYEVLERPKALFNLDSVCLGAASIPVLKNRYSAQPQFLWELGDGSIATDSDLVHTFVNPGDFLVKLSLRNQYGCEDSHRVVTHVFPEPDARFVLQILPENRLRLTADHYANIQKQEWLIDGSSVKLTNDGLSPSLMAGTYYVEHEVIDSSGCLGIYGDSIEVFGSDVFFYPNPFRDVFNVAFSLPFGSLVEVEMHTSAGQEVYGFEEWFVAGQHEFVFPGELAYHAAGVYICNIWINGKFIDRVKMVKIN